MLWLYGRPDLYLLLVPGLGAACDIVARAAGRPLANTDVARGALAAVAMFGFGAWAAGTKVADAIILPTYSPLTAAVVLPIGVLVLLWLDTLRRAGRLSGSAALGFVVAAILAWAPPSWRASRHQRGRSRRGRVPGPFVASARRCSCRRRAAHCRKLGAGRPGYAGRVQTCCCSGVAASSPWAYLAAGTPGPARERWATASWRISERLIVLLLGGCLVLGPRARGATRRTGRRRR